MSITIDLPEELVNEAMRLCNVKSKIAVVIFALQEMIRRRKMEGLRKLKGKLDLNLDLDTSRRFRAGS